MLFVPNEFMTSSKKSKKGWILVFLIGLMVLGILSVQYIAKNTIHSNEGLELTKLTGFNPDKILFSDGIGNITSEPFNKYYIPPNTIVMWFSETIPVGWAECNGENGTPDLRGRFPLAFNNSQGATANAIGKTGGAEKVQLTESQIPSHIHTGTTDGGGYGTDIWKRVAGSDSGADNSGSHSHNFTTNYTGGNQAHENMPPYYVLKFIIKL